MTSRGSHLGVDIGTTSVKCCLLVGPSASSSTVLHSKQVHNADVVFSDNKHEQSALCIMSAIRAALGTLAEQSRTAPDSLAVDTVSVCCQMHGVLLWNDEHDVSNLITWQDHRCTDEFVTKLRGFTEFGDDLHTGYGSATLAWLAHHTPEVLTKYRHCGTVADYFVYVLCGLKESVISDHNAQSWGYFDEVTHSWDTSAFSKAQVSINLPKIVENGNGIGCVVNETFNIQPGARVCIPIGDLQASVYSVLGCGSGRVFNYGTASQIVQTADPHDHKQMLPSVRRTLYTGNHNLVTAASLNGGNATEVIFKLFSSLSTDQKLDHDTVMELAYEKRNSSLRICPVFFGERHATKTFGSFTNVTADNFTVGDVSAAVFKGVVENLCDMMRGVDYNSDDVLYAVGIAERPILQYFLREFLGDFVLFDKEVTAAYGAIFFDLGNQR